jgi:hypothetical protein
LADTASSLFYIHFDFLLLAVFEDNKGQEKSPSPGAHG